MNLKKNYRMQKRRPTISLKIKLINLIKKANKNTQNSKEDILKIV
jgi:hypothetical protein